MWTNSDSAQTVPTKLRCYEKDLFDPAVHNFFTPNEERFVPRVSIESTGHCHGLEGGKKWMCVKSVSVVPLGFSSVRASIVNWWRGLGSDPRDRWRQHPDTQLTVGRHVWSQSVGTNERAWENHQTASLQVKVCYGPISVRLCIYRQYVLCQCVFLSLSRSLIYMYKLE